MNIKLNNRGSISNGVAISIGIHLLVIVLLVFSSEIKKLPILGDLINQRTQADFSQIGSLTSQAANDVTVAYVKPEKNAITKVKEKSSAPNRTKTLKPEASPTTAPKKSKVKVMLAKIEKPVLKEQTDVLTPTTANKVTQSLTDNQQDEISKEGQEKLEKAFTDESIPAEQDLIKNPNPPEEESFETLAARNAGGGNSNAIRDGRKLKQMAGNPKPSYPESARLTKDEGTVVLKYEITRNGNVRDIRVAESSGSSILDREAIMKVRQWKFQPGQEGETLHPVIFQLKGPSEKLRSRLRTSQPKKS